MNRMIRIALVALFGVAPVMGCNGDDDDVRSSRSTTRIESDGDRKTTKTTTTDDGRTTKTTTEKKTSD